MGSRIRYVINQLLWSNLSRLTSPKFHFHTLMYIEAHSLSTIIQLVISISLSVYWSDHLYSFDHGKSLIMREKFSRIIKLLPISSPDRVDSSTGERNTFAARAEAWSWSCPAWSLWRGRRSSWPVVGWTASCGASPGWSCRRSRLWTEDRYLDWKGFKKSFNKTINSKYVNLWSYVSEFRQR